MKKQIELEKEELNKLKKAAKVEHRSVNSFIRHYALIGAEDTLKKFSE